jgi:hypothetical protein
MSTFLDNRALLVLGMHRSGTSVFTGVLEALGVELSPHLMPSHADNPSGYWEHLEIVEVHDALLHAFGSCWHEVCPLPDRWWLDERVDKYRAKIAAILRRDFGDTPLWGLKDPRLCRLLPLWLPLLRELRCAPHFALVGRSPWAIARSLHKRDQFSESKSLLLWLEHLLEAERGSRGFPRGFTTYEALLADWRGALNGVQNALALEWPVPLETAAGTIETLLQPPANRPEPASSPGWVETAWKCVQAAGVEGESALLPLTKIHEELLQAQTLFGPEIAGREADLQARLNEFANGFSSLQLAYENLETSCQELRAERDKKRQKLNETGEKLQQTKAALRATQAELKAMKQSLVWKLLRPLFRKPAK